ncbi:unnamed protein product [Durusdinium trenchii]|uniref:Uncharacterized protein n=1 Tax=Durusdinium trenchii TaxID=1381693 RepID=A0ABP0PWA0_9DINO
MVLLHLTIEANAIHCPPLLQVPDYERRMTRSNEPVRIVCQAEIDLLSGVLSAREKACFRGLPPDEYHSEGLQAAKLSEMILDQKLNGTLDQGIGVLIVFDQEQVSSTYDNSLKTIKNTSEVLDTLYGQAKQLA